MFWWFLIFFIFSTKKTIASIFAQTWQKMDSKGTRERWLFNMRWMGTQRVQMKGVHFWLVRWACSAGTRDFCSAFAALVGQIQNIFLPTVPSWFQGPPRASGMLRRKILYSYVFRGQIWTAQAADCIELKMWHHESGLKYSTGIITVMYTLLR